MSTFRPIFSLTAIGLCAASVAGQFDQPLKPLDQTVEDINPLSASLRETQTDLREPNGFFNVYHVPGRSDLLMRINGGVYAVFPQSAYAKSKRGVVPLVPAGTVFYIGLPEELAGRKTVPLHATAVVNQVDDQIHDRFDEPVDERSRTRTLPEPGGPRRGDREGSGEASSVGRTIVTDAAYRYQRVSELMARAAHAAASNADPSESSSHSEEHPDDAS